MEVGKEPRYEVERSRKRRKKKEVREKSGIQ